MNNQYAVRTITCKGCGEIVHKRLRPDQAYCSLECYRAGKRPQRKTGKDVACELCGKMVYVTAQRLASASHYFCCSAHANEWQGRNKTDHTCKVCGNDFRWSPSRTQSGKYNVTYCSMECRDKDPERTAQLRRLNAKQLTMKPNNLERAAYVILDTIGVPYERQHMIADKFCVDAFVPSLGIVIQFDGDYWHGNPAKFTELDHRQSRRATLDKSQDAYMQACGYRVIRIWESAIKASPDHVRQLLAAELKP